MNFYHDQNNWQHNLIPIELSRNDSDRVVDLIIYKNHCALFRKLNAFLVDHHKNFICRRCLKSNTSEYMLMIHKPKCENNDITTIRTSDDTQVFWKKQFHKNPLYFRINADFEADREIEDNKVVCKKTTKINKQNPMLNGYHIESELDDVLKSGYSKSPLGYNNVYWFVNEVIKSKNKMNFWFKNTKKDFIMTKEYVEDFKNNIICRFSKKEFISDKVRDHCHLTGKSRGSAHNTFIINVEHKQSNFITFLFHNFINYDCHQFFKKLMDKKNGKVNFDNIPETNEDYISVTYGCIRFIDSFRFLLSSLSSLVKTPIDNSHKT